MLKAFSLATLLLYISSPCTDASASPISVAEKVYPEVIPGPGLPSLASLELTSAELYQKSPAPDNKYKRDKLFTPFCGGRHGDTANVDDVIACYNYLQRIGGNTCRIPADNNQHIMCTAGTATVAGVDVGSRDTSSSCSDVALGVQHVFTHCNTNGQVEGDAPAHGNGDLVVVVGGPL